MIFKSADLCKFNLKLLYRITFPFLFQPVIFYQTFSSGIEFFGAFCKNKLTIGKYYDTLKSKGERTQIKSCLLSIFINL